MDEVKEWPPEKLEELKKENEKLTKTMEYLKKTAMVTYMDYFTLEDNNVSGNVYTVDWTHSGSSEISVHLVINGKDFSYTYEVPKEKLVASNRVSEIMSLFHKSLAEAIATWTLGHIHLRDV